MGSAGLRALVVLSDASCVGRESLHACCEFAGIDALLVKKRKGITMFFLNFNFGPPSDPCYLHGPPNAFQTIVRRLLP